MVDVAIAPWVLGWFLIAIAVLARYWRSGAGAGLMFMYVFTFAVLHWLSAALYLLPWYDRTRLEMTYLGLRESTIALAALAIGAEIVAVVVKPRTSIAASFTPRMVDTRVVNLYLLVGFALYVMVFVAGRFAGLAAVVSTGAVLAVIAIGLKCWNAFLSGHRSQLWMWLVATIALPLMTVLGQGFLGYGFSAMLTVFAFVASFYRPRWKVVAIGLCFAYIGLSVYVTYMRDRRDIRAVVWAGAGMNDRVTQLVDTFANGEWFDIQNQQHLTRIDDRLNQSFLVGSAVAYLSSNAVPFANGETLVQSVAAVVPRILWPNKPSVAGSGDLVSEYTGINFVEGTSVGIGQVMEAYINYGRAGVVVVFLFLGAGLCLIDRMAYAQLVRGDASRFLLWYLPGLSMLQIGGAFAEITASAAAGVVVAVVLAWLVARTLPDRRGTSRSGADTARPLGQEVRM